MTRDEERNERALQRYLAIDALLDGEAVDSDALRSALDQSDVRNYLVETLLVRQLTRDAGPRTFMVSGKPLKPMMRGLRWLAATLILIVGSGGGYVYGLRSQIPDAGPSSSSVSIENAPQSVAPQPTHVIRFEPGVNWTTTKESR